MTTSEQSATSAAAVSVDPPPPTVWPTLQATDARALIAFYVEAFGFAETAVYGDGDRVEHAQLDWPEGGGIMLGSHKPDAEWSRSPGTFGAYVVTDRVDEVYARAVRAGARVVREPAEEDYGNREFILADPEGNLWSFGTYRGEPWGAA